MTIDRRTVLSGLATALAAPRIARAAGEGDRIGRMFAPPAKVERVFAAGPPAAILLYTLAPELLLGWTAGQPAGGMRVPAAGGLRPARGRPPHRPRQHRQSRSVLALKPDLILDVGTINRHYVSLADRVQEQTGIPYALLDGRFAAIAATYRKLGELIHRGGGCGNARALRRNNDGDDHGTHRPDPRKIGGRASTTRAVRAGWRPGSAARSMSRPSSFWARRTSPASARAAWPRSRSSRCWPGIPT